MCWLCSDLPLFFFALKSFFVVLTLLVSSDMFLKCRKSRSFFFFSLVPVSITQKMVIKRKTKQFDQLSVVLAKLVAAPPPSHQRKLIGSFIFSYKFNFTFPPSFSSLIKALFFFFIISLVFSLVSDMQIASSDDPPAPQPLPPANATADPVADKQHIAHFHSETRWRGAALQILSIRSPDDSRHLLGHLWAWPEMARQGAGQSRLLPVKFVLFFFSGFHAAATLKQKQIVFMMISPWMLTGVMPPGCFF